MRTLPWLVFAVLATVSCSPAPEEAPSAEAAGELEVEELLRYGSEAMEQLNLDRQMSGDLDAMLQRRVIRALVIPSRTYYFLDGPVQKGVAYESLRLFEKWLNEELGSDELKVHVMIIPTTRDRIFEALVDGRGDIAASGLTITEERSDIVDFGDPVMSDVAEVAVTGPSGPALNSVDDLAGQQVHVRLSSSYYQSLTALNERFRAEGKPEVEMIPADDYLEDEDLLQMVDAGILGTVIVDRHKAEFWKQIYANINVHADVAVRTGGRIAWAFRKDSPQLAELVDRFVAGHRQGTLLGNIVLNRYLRDAAAIRNVLAGDERRQYTETAALFRQYAPEYGFDALMMIAQGFQESGLDQSRRSNRGAVGIMQLLPTTAADPSVGIPNIEEADANVHAGIRYMSWIRDTYFDDPAVSDLDKTLFSFASYNAGPNRIARLRAAAADKGFDPNVWFRNVEVIVAEDIGRETVDYVSNIYKYYAAYRLLEGREITQ